MFCKVNGNKPLTGEIEITGAKNDILKLIIASTITNGDVILNNVPFIEDIYEKVHLLNELKVNVQYIKNNSLILNSSNIVPSFDFNCRLRTGSLFAGILLGRFGFCSIPMPAGDRIGSRNIDMHLDLLEKMQTTITSNNNILHFQLKHKRLQAIEYTFRFQSVGATENGIFAACFAEGTTVLNNSAIEPEIVNLCLFLKKLGVNINGIGTSRITIEGKESYNNSVEYSAINDRIQLMTYMLLPIIVSNSEVKIVSNDFEHMGEFLSIVLKLGIELAFRDNYVICSRKSNKKIPFIEVETKPFPFLATDIQPILAVALSLACEKSVLYENIYDNRFGYIEELNKMGGKITKHSLNNKEFIQIEGIDQFHGSKVFINDLRAGAALLFAALNAKEESTIVNVYHLNRGYDNIIGNLQHLGANICFDLEK
jgi:UDP-N-acetylglucosamine 1-carboxyvinyltransferase